MQPLVALSIHDWYASCPDVMRAQALDTIERGALLYLPELRFDVSEDERALLTPANLNGRRKNISLDLKTGVARGTHLQGDPLHTLSRMMRRFADGAGALVAQLLPSYVSAIRQARVSYRPAEVDHRRLSPRKDDRRLHVDAFASRPTHGERILRVFTNINQSGMARHWQVGEPFEECARRFLPAIPRPWPGAHALLAALRVTKGIRSDYDHYMLRMHDRMKTDEHYQREAPRQDVRFPAGSSWIVFSDQTLHAALSGQHLLEQTLHVPIEAMRSPERAPLRVLERLAGRRLA
ncbi:MAG: Kdo hydroxylase family protein [Acidiferrobacteraceae bacterium]